MKRKRVDTARFTFQSMAVVVAAEFIMTSREPSWGMSWLK